jgi:hypothetical protein
MITDENQGDTPNDSVQGNILSMMHTKPFVQLLLLATSLALTGQAQDALSTGLVAYYPFNGNANDESGKANHGTTNGGPQPDSDRFDHGASAYRLNGTTDWISAAGSSTLNITGDLTISLWVKPRIAGNSRDLVLLSYSKRNVDNDQYAFGLNYLNRLFSPITTRRGTIP